jgi:sterol desaturase/sphingolipid hydroxylase (fatty acid hydroxylase superfamily)
MHRVHHQLGHHAQNYGLPLWDMLFRTWVNPKEYVTHCGFDEMRALRISDMLLGVDVHKK